MIEELIYVYGDRDEVIRLICDLCKRGASIEEAYERLIMLASAGDPVIDFADLDDDSACITIEKNRKKD